MNGRLEKGDRTGPVVVALLVLALGWLWTGMGTDRTRWEVVLQSEEGGILVWYIDTGEGFSENEGGYAGVAAGELVTAAVELPTGTVRKIRLDPVNGGGSILLRSIRWIEPWPGGTGTLDPAQADWYGVAQAGPTPEGDFSVVVEENGSDPYGVWPDSPGHSRGWWLAFRAGVSLALAGLVYLAATFWNRSLRKRMKSPGESHTAQSGSES